MSESADVRVALADPSRFSAECRALWLELRDHHGTANPEMGPLHADDVSWERARTMYDRCLAGDGAFLVLAEQDGAAGPLGCAVVDVRDGSPTWAESGRFGYLELICVAPATRGLGVGRRILDVVQAELDRIGASEMRLAVMSENLGAQSFYRELGFATYALEMRRPARPARTDAP